MQVSLFTLHLTVEQTMEAERLLVVDARSALRASTGTVQEVAPGRKAHCALRASIPKNFLSIFIPVALVLSLFTLSTTLPSSCRANRVSGSVERAWPAY